MARTPQPDLFGSEEPQAELFDAEAAIPAYRPDLDDARARLHRILAEARAAEKLPWDRDKLIVYRAIVPHMAGWSPAGGGAQLQLAFDAELPRLKAA